MDGSDDAAKLNGTIDICPSLDYIEKAYDDAKQLGWAKKPIISMCLPSTLDDSLAPPGSHVMSLFCQHFNPDLPDGRTWDDVRDEVADLIIDTVNDYAPNFKASIGECRNKVTAAEYTIAVPITLGPDCCRVDVPSEQLGQQSFSDQYGTGCSCPREIFRRQCPCGRPPRRHRRDS